MTIVAGPFIALLQSVSWSRRLHAFKFRWSLTNLIAFACFVTLADRHQRNRQRLGLYPPHKKVLLTKLYYPEGRVTINQANPFAYLVQL